MPNSGWFDAIGAALREGAAGMDRYALMRQQDEENQWKRQMREMQMKEFQQGQQMNQRQLENLDLSILGHKKEQFQDTYGPDTVLDDDAAQYGKMLGYGGLMKKKPTLDFSGGPTTQLPGIDIAGVPELSHGPTQGVASQDKTWFSGTSSQRREEDQLRRARELQDLQIGGLRDAATDRGRTRMDADTVRRKKAEFEQFVHDNPKASEQDLIRGALQNGVEAPEALQWILDYKGRLAAANATLGAANVRGNTALQSIDAKGKWQLLNTAATQGSANARSQMANIRSVMAIDPDRGMQMLEDLDVQSLISGSTPQVPQGIGGGPIARGGPSQTPFGGGPSPLAPTFDARNGGRGGMDMAGGGGSHFGANGQLDPQAQMILDLMAKYQTSDLGQIIDLLQQQDDPSTRLDRNMQTALLQSAQGDPEFLKLLIQRRNKGR